MFNNTPLASASASSMHKNASSSSSSSCSTSAISSSSSSSSSSPYAYNNHCMVTPPMSLPSRGWGDSGGGFSGGSFRTRPYPHPHPAGLPHNHAVPTSITSNSNYSLHGSSRHDCVAGGGGAGAAGKGSGEQQQQLLRRLDRFSLSDGFSSAEEETWGSEGEIEETAEAGRRHALVTVVPNGQSYHLGAGAIEAAAGRNGSGDDGREREEEEEGDGESEESRGLLVKDGPRTTTVVVVGATGTAAAIAPFYGNGGVLGLGVSGRRKAAVGAGRAKRRACLVARASRGAGRGAPAGGTQNNGVGGGLGAGEAGTGRQWCGNGGGGGSKRPRKVSRPLFIEIENKASEPPRVPRQTAAQKKAAAARGYRSRTAAVGQEQQQQRRRQRRRRTGHVGSSAEDADDEQGDSDEEDAFCGCAHRCLRLADSWYRAVVGGPTRVKFSELDQIAEMPAEMP
ncbi:unnamed protein product [Scytosiphon promiscuus]